MLVRIVIILVIIIISIIIVMIEGSLRGPGGRRGRRARSGLGLA